MPLHLEPLDMSVELEGYKSVLIVSCPICPPVSLATDGGSPLMEFFRSGIKTGAYEDYVREVRKSLEERGVKTGVFTSYLPCTAMCLWTKGQRNRLWKRAKDYEAALVMGCESARYTVEETLKNTDCRVLLGMRLVGITNATLKFEFPLTAKLEDLARVKANEVIQDDSHQRPMI
ncbi:MAG: hypothetical protein OES09_16140 [Gammaproteobacteria bacterium]|nr:hypothetical protein [Gammaproteobacteria bacterium]